MGVNLDERLGLYVVTADHADRGRCVEEVVRAAINGGATAIQLRAKDMGGLRMYRLATRLRDITAAADVLFIVNDRLDVALAAEADGVHLGQRDLPLTAAAELARRALGRPFVLGMSAENVEQAVIAESEGAHYIGAGPVWPTQTKPDAAPSIGPGGLGAICARVRIPVVAIGGIDHRNAAIVLATGVAGLAVVSAVAKARDVEASARSLADIVRAYRSASQERGVDLKLTFRPPSPSAENGTSCPGSR